MLLILFLAHGLPWSESFHQYYHLPRLPGVLYLRATNPAEAGFWLSLPNAADFSQVFCEGNTLPLAWAGWPESTVETYLQGNKISRLWVTSFVAFYASRIWPNCQVGRV